MVQRHWWNGSDTARSRRDVYIRSDGLQWDVLVQIGGTAGRYRVQECPSSSAAVIVADAWRGSGIAWRELAPPPQAAAPRKSVLERDRDRQLAVSPRDDGGRQTAR